MKAMSRRDRIAAQLADLKMPGALEALAEVLARVDGGSATAPKRSGSCWRRRSALRNSRWLATAIFRATSNIQDRLGQGGTERGADRVRADRLGADVPGHPRDLALEAAIRRLQYIAALPTRHRCPRRGSCPCRAAPRTMML